MENNSLAWQWSPTSCLLQDKLGTIFEDLTPTVRLFPEEQVEIRIQIDMQRVLETSRKDGWKWHKCWNLPSIYLKIEAELRTVKSLGEKQGTPILCRIDMKGKAQTDIKKGECVFNSMKINETSHQHKGAKFHLLLSVSSAQGYVKTLISPPFHIDSRKELNVDIRDYCIEVVRPFDVTALDKRFIKKIKKNEELDIVDIGEDAASLLNYYSAPNIRNKIKHPIFLALRFPQCLRIYFNCRYLGRNPHHILYEFEKCLLEGIMLPKSATAIGKMRFVILWRQPSALEISTLGQESELQRLLAFFKKMESPTFGVFSSGSSLPDYFQAVVDGEKLDLRQDYVHSLPRIKSLYRTYYKKNEIRPNNNIIFLKNNDSVDGQDYEEEQDCPENSSLPVDKKQYEPSMIDLDEPQIIPKFEYLEATRAKTLPSSNNNNNNNSNSAPQEASNPPAQYSLSPLQPHPSFIGNYGVQPHPGMYRNQHMRPPHPPGVYFPPPIPPPELHRNPYMLVPNAPLQMMNSPPNMYMIQQQQHNKALMEYYLNWNMLMNQMFTL